MSSSDPAPKAGINLKSRLKTAGILLPIVCLCPMFPQSWFLLNMGFPLACIWEYHSMMEKILDFIVPESKDKQETEQLKQLVRSVNNRYCNLAYTVLIHLSVLFCESML